MNNLLLLEIEICTSMEKHQICRNYFQCVGYAEKKCTSWMMTKMLHDHIKFYRYNVNIFIFRHWKICARIILTALDLHRMVLWNIPFYQKLISQNSIVPVIVGECISQVNVGKLCTIHSSLNVFSQSRNHCV